MKPIEKALIAITIAEIAAPLSVVLLQPGFDKKNSLGLDFDFVVQMGWCFAILWIVGMCLATVYRKEKKRYFVTYLVFSPGFAATLLGGYCLYLK